MQQTKRFQRFMVSWSLKNQKTIFFKKKVNCWNISRVHFWNFVIIKDLTSTQELNGPFTAQSGLELFLMSLTAVVSTFGGS